MRMRRCPGMANPLLVEEYCRLRCHGSEKLGSLCTQNTCRRTVPSGCKVDDAQHSLRLVDTHAGLRGRWGQEENSGTTFVPAGAGLTHLFGHCRLAPVDKHLCQAVVPGRVSLPSAETGKHLEHRVHHVLRHTGPGTVGCQGFCGVHQGRTKPPGGHVYFWDACNGLGCLSRIPAPGSSAFALGLLWGNASCNAEAEQCA